MMTAEELYHFDLKGYLLVKRAFEPDLIRLGFGGLPIYDLGRGRRHIGDGLDR